MVNENPKKPDTVEDLREVAETLKDFKKSYTQFVNKMLDKKYLLTNSFIDGNIQYQKTLEDYGIVLAMITNVSHEVLNDLKSTIGDKKKKSE